MANEKRGEIELKLNGSTYTLRPTFRAFAEIESRVGPLFDVWGRVQSGSLVSVATIIWSAVTDGGRERRPTLDEIGQAVMDVGLSELSKPIGEFLVGPTTGLLRPTDEGGEGDEESSGKSS